MAQSRSIKHAIILAHGRGDDCFPYGGEGALRGKYAMEVDDIPLVRRVFDSIREVGVKDVTVAVGFLADATKEVFADLAEGDRPRFVSVEPYDRGDAPVLASVIKQVGRDGDVLVANGDLFAHPSEYRAVVDAFAASEGKAVCVLIDELDAEEDALSWHTVSVDGGGKITAFNGPVAGGKLRVSGGYAIPAGKVDALASPPPATAEDRVYLAGRLGAMLGSDTAILGIRASTPVVHVDRCFDYLEANMTQVHFKVKAIPGLKGAYVYRGGEGQADPRYVFPGTIIRKGATLVFEEGAFVSPYDTLDEHLAAIKDAPRQVTPIRIRGDLFLGAGARIGLGAEIEGGVYVWPGANIDDSVIETDVIIGAGAIVRRKGFVRHESVLMAKSRIECAADFEGTSGPGTIFMHPSQCWICNGKGCDCGAGNFFGTWRFDSKASKFLIRGRQVAPKLKVANATFMGDNVRSAVMVNFTPGTRIGSNTLIGPGIVASGRLEANKGYLLKQDVVKARVSLLRR
ncbi:MAG: NTP transferase domain-containing protein [Phycisphaerae bacterium]|nr:NTP transferase domain-containing protein [Phycisphaerae bacterium]